MVQTPDGFQHDPGLASPPGLDDDNAENQAMSTAASAMPTEDEISKSLDSCGYKPSEFDMNFLERYAIQLERVPNKTPNAGVMANILNCSHIKCQKRLQDPAFLGWLNLGLEYIRVAKCQGLYEKAYQVGIQKGDMTAIKFFCERFDPVLRERAEARRSARRGGGKAASASSPTNMTAIMEFIQKKTGAPIADVRALLSGKARIVRL